MPKSKEKEHKNNKKSKGGKFFRELVAILSWVTVLMLWLCAGSAYINPNHFRYLSVLGLAFPFCLGGVLAMLLICLLFARRKSWIPILGLLVSFFSIRAYCPLNFPSAHPKSCYKLLSYNTMSFATGTKDSAKEESMLEYINHQNADFFCYQEGNCIPVKLLDEKILPTISKTLPHHDKVKVGESFLGCSSKYPIIKSELICRNGMNGAAVFHILLKAKDTLQLINCHLQSMGLSKDERNQYHEIVKHLNDSNMESHSRLLISKISKASLKRAHQADSIADYVERNKGKNIIICGDFNDTPISYTYQRILSTGLTNAYSATGNGIGRSFNRDAIYVRIDHMFCSEHWKPYGCRIDNTIDASDHNPLVCYLERIVPEVHETEKEPERKTEGDSLPH